MKKPRRRTSEDSDDLRPEYRFDYSKARPNPYASRLKGKTVAVVLDTEVAAAFPTSEAVNTALRAVMIQRRSKRSPRATARRFSKQSKRTRSVPAKKRRG